MQFFLGGVSMGLILAAKQTVESLHQKNKNVHDWNFPCFFVSCLISRLKPTRSI